MIWPIVKNSVGIAIVMAAAASSALSQSGPSREEQLACRSDATRLCAAHIGKPPEMNVCLRDNKTKLSDPCRKVVEARGG